MAFKLGDDGTLDTVVYCDDCGEEVRYNFDPGWGRGYRTVQDSYDSFIEWALDDAADQHDCPRRRMADND